MKRALLLLVIAAVAPIAAATTVRSASVERLSQLSTLVVEGRATDSWTQWNPQHTVIHTYTRFQVAQTLKGQHAHTVVVRQYGGMKDGIRQVLFGVRHFQVGEDAVLFLQPASDGNMEVVDLMQGNFLVHHTKNGASVSNGVPGVTELSRDGRVRTYTGTNMSLQQLESRVRLASTK